MCSDKRKIRLTYLEGLRGLAALCVLLEHTYQAMRFGSTVSLFPTKLVALLSVFNQGQLPVDIFIVLSGYCLMLPVVRSADGQLRGGWWQYIKRRSRRILPAYYSALFVSLLVLVAIAAVNSQKGQILQGDNFRLDVIISHFLLIHNLKPSWIHAINGPMWSVATEWQIYFIFPLLLLPVWRQYGTMATICSGFAIGLLPHWFFHGYFDEAFPWFIGLFALGMAGAILNYTADPQLITWREKVPWGSLSLVLWLSIIGFCCVRRGWYAQHQIIADPIIGLATMCLLVHCTRHYNGQNPNKSLVAHMLNDPRAVWLGTFSYSLYLIHYPLLQFDYAIIVRLPVSGVIKFAVFLLSLPVIVLLSYGFHLLFERRFLSDSSAHTATRLLKYSSSA